MAILLNKPGAELLVDLINQTNSSNYGYDDFVFGLPSTHQDGIYNTRIDIVDTVIEGLSVPFTLQYKRLDLATLFADVTLEFQVDDTSAVTEQGILDQLFTSFGVLMSLDDVAVDVSVESAVLATVTITALSDALVFTGSMVVSAVAEAVPEPAGLNMPMMFMRSLQTFPLPEDEVIEKSTSVEEDLVTIDLGRYGSNSSVTVLLSDEDGRIELSNSGGMKPRTEYLDRYYNESNPMTSMVVLPEEFKFRKLKLDFEIWADQVGANWLTTSVIARNINDDVYNRMDSIGITTEPQRFTYEIEYPENDPGSLEELYIRVQRAAHEGFTFETERYPLELKDLVAFRNNRWALGVETIRHPHLTDIRIEPVNNAVTFADGSVLTELEPGLFELTLGSIRTTVDSHFAITAAAGIEDLGRIALQIVSSEVGSFQWGDPDGLQTVTVANLTLPETSTTRLLNNNGVMLLNSTEAGAAGKKIQFRLQALRYTEASSVRTHIRFLSREIDTLPETVDISAEGLYNSYANASAQFDFDLGAFLGQTVLSVRPISQNASRGLAVVTADKRCHFIARRQSSRSHWTQWDALPGTPWYDFKHFSIDLPTELTLVDSPHAVSYAPARVDRTIHATESGLVMARYSLNTTTGLPTPIVAVANYGDDIEIYERHVDHTDVGLVDINSTSSTYTEVVLARIISGANAGRNAIITAKLGSGDNATFTIVRHVLPATMVNPRCLGHVKDRLAVLADYNNAPRYFYGKGDLSQAIKASPSSTFDSWYHAPPALMGISNGTQNVRFQKNYLVLENGSVYLCGDALGTSWTKIATLPAEFGRTQFMSPNAFQDYRPSKPFFYMDRFLDDPVYSRERYLFTPTEARLVCRFYHVDRLGQRIEFDTRPNPDNSWVYTYNGVLRWNDDFTHMRVDL